MGRRTFNRIRTQCGLVKKERPEQQEQKKADRDTKRQRHDALLPPHFLIKNALMKILFIRYNERVNDKGLVSPTLSNVCEAQWERGTAEEEMTLVG